MKPVFEFLLIFFIIKNIKASSIRNFTQTREPEQTCGQITNSKLCVRIDEKFYIIDGNAEINWFEAQRYCRRLNANLVTIESAKELHLISKHLISKNYDLGDHYFWTSGNDLGSEGTFYSIANGKLLPYTEWTKGQPDNSHDNEHCIHLWKKMGGFGMNDGVCTRKAHLICEFDERIETYNDDTPIFDIRHDWVNSKAGKVF